MKINKISILKFYFSGMKLRAGNTFTLAMNEYGQITRVKRHFRDFSIEIPPSFSVNWTQLDENFV